MYLHFSPLQQRSGVLVFHKHGYTFNLLVLPKLWRPTENRPNPYPWCHGIRTKTVYVVAYEGERHFLGDPPIEWKQLLTECSDILSSQSQPHETDTSTDDSDTSLDADTMRSLQHLIQIVGKPKESVLNEFLDIPDESAQEHWNTQVEELQKLAWFADAKRKLSIDIFHTTDDSLVSITENRMSREISPLFRLLVIENFLSEMEKYNKEIHQGYVSVTEKTNTIKGSLTGKSLVLLDAGVSLSPECRYNKFVPNIPLYQVLVSTLDSILDGFCLPSCFVEIKEQNIQQRALLYRQQLEYISSLSIEIASHTSEQLYLPASQRHWQPALDMAKILLQNHDSFLQDTKSGTGGYMWIVDTARVWEEILRQSIRTWNTSAVKNTEKQPWNGLGNTIKPDIIFDSIISDKDCETANQQYRYIFDAKYKISSSTQPKTPSKSEEYQMFAYSHLFGNSCPIHIGLVYPVQTVPSSGLLPRKHTRNPNSYHNCHLSIYHLPFPSTEDVQNQDAWKAKIHCIEMIWKTQISPTTV